MSETDKQRIREELIKRFQNIEVEKEAEEDPRLEGFDPITGEILEGYENREEQQKLQEKRDEIEKKENKNVVIKYNSIQHALGILLAGRTIRRTFKSRRQVATFRTVMSRALKIYYQGIIATDVGTTRDLQSLSIQKVYPDEADNFFYDIKLIDKRGYFEMEVI